MSSPSKVEIIIYDAPAAASSGCACGCGGHGHDHEHGHAVEDPIAKVSIEMQARALAMTMQKDFPGRVTVEYVNVLKDPRGPHLPQTKLLCSMTYPTPLVYLNGKGRFAGAVPVERLREEVQKLLSADVS
ncbi:MAG: hypothetical protein QME75_12175 [Deltaproteobacteria bacterium]|nr:hypothetical protein [Deltaproteobacteria bacterium]